MDANANNGRDEEAGTQATQRSQRFRSNVPSFLFISFILFMLTSHNGDEFLARHQYQDALQSLTYQLSNYTSWLNGTAANFTMDERDTSIPPLLEAFHVQGKELDPSRESYYPNVTGFIHGSSTLTNITLPSLKANQTIPWGSLAEKLMHNVNTTYLSERLGSWDWSSSTRLSLSITESLPRGVEHTSDATVSLVHGRIEISDNEETETLRLDFKAARLKSNGAIYGFAEPPGRSVDIRLLPSLVPEKFRNETARIIKPELEARIDKLTNLIDAGVIDLDSSTDDTPKTTCPFAFFGQLHAAQIPYILMQELEEEMQNPTGIHTVPPPELSLDGILLSKECGLLFELSETEGLRLKVFSRKVTTYAGLTTISYLIILVLFSRQAERSRTPSGISRVSRWTFISQTVMDVLSFAGHITFAILAEGRPSLSLIAPAFLSSVMFTYQGQFAALIHQIQGPENFTPPAPVVPAASPSTPPAPAHTSRTTVTNTARGSSQEPLLPITSREGSPSPAPAPIAATPAVQPTTAANNGPPTTFFAFFIHHVRTDPQARMWLLMIFFLMIMIRVIISPTLSVIFVVAAYSSIWLPQILRSIRRARSSGLSKEYVLGTTACRLYSLLYFLICPKNVLDIDPRPWVWWLALNVIIQAIIVILQDVLGPTFFLPQRYAESKAYDYHPPIPVPDSESPEQSLGDCGICMDAILVDPSLRHHRRSVDSKEYHDEKGTTLSTTTGVGGVFNAMQMRGRSNARRSYSLAPCSHLFHTECLEKWLAIKNICPQCRRPLPPL
ncbi:hypothetical protein CPB83DRAFT_84315 [Crepidotus variabilis]|uniref:RING-type E3 ubiquitin transferase n=1 Tax=Crepidotus variabilis TaxID=179855 RepID=A0A9P6JTN8_9AGAR|nr:hypothetical protein CPB83DRAFT_84315 [Crepidotus variabilis]